MLQQSKLASVGVISLMLGLVGCTNNQTSDTAVDFPQALNVVERTTTTKKLSGSVVVDGSSTVFPISQAMAAAFTKNNPDVKVNVGVSGTGGGFKKFCAGETDITGASRPIKTQEMELCRQNKIEYTELPIAFDGLAVVVSSQNNFVSCLKTGELKQMWEPAAQGKTTNWNQVRDSFPDRPLQLYGPDVASGTFDYFTLAIVGKEGRSRTDYKPSANDDALVQGVATNPNALGYFGYAYYLKNRDKLKLVAIDSGSGCIQPSPETIANSSYQPLSRPIFIYVKKVAAARPEVNAFTNFYLSPDNANLVLQVGDVPLPNITLRAAASRFNRGMTGTNFGGRGAIIGVAQEGL
ncbi:PstS family phosphate ABC transporter substrate-binding protein [Chroococcidiopsis sp. FACHB-1243]|uniref:PstS family phosphate ABC transporter substrate-binding protein n=1 Tax=Chroococcidiopsis sp. [FACHB-1243] TaxID=2692781 RepID=UPI00177A9B68|nr:PstS family phosphate ABC transporter substrate-binding protein [Chroococcidiopsis sp. [FACHB-1243]]MBD2308187.1 PstS family phosphate ABC transporter substrate-binding protein [Chroococcidiopsis sp. [FACHB-1243]]